jgi:hypothetical protein
MVRTCVKINTMAAKARITADFATPSEVASRLRIPPARTEELRRQMSNLESIPVVGVKRPGRSSLRMRTSAKKK